MQIVELTDPAEARERALPYLASRPAEHNLLLTILDQSIEHSLDAAFWLVVDGAEVTGFALESPRGMGIVLAAMPPPVTRLLAETVPAPLYRVVGEAGAAATFAGRFTECNTTAVTKIKGQRLYELSQPRPVGTARGSARPAGPHDRATLVEWTRAFVAELGEVPQDAEAVVDARVAREQFWVWDDGGPVAMASASLPAAGVVRVQHVYTPTARRGAGYATACVEHMSRALTDRGLRCVLYTDLANPTSNGIYRRIGYEAVSEILAYQFA